jgi:hypothetical protein
MGTNQNECRGTCIPGGDGYSPQHMPLHPSGRCQETSTRDAANKHSLELCASIVHVFLDGCSEWYVTVVFLAGQVLVNGMLRGVSQTKEITYAW